MFFQIQFIYFKHLPLNLHSDYEPNDKNQSLTESDPCWTSMPSLSRLSVYRLFVCALNVVVGPFVFFNMQKTKFIQMISTVVRWLAFVLMMSLACVKIVDNSQKSIEMKPALVNFSSLPNFVGICIYAFMIHHSLPSILAPIKRKEKFMTILLFVYMCTMAFYFLNSYLAVFAFGSNLKDLYTLNFLPEKGASDNDQLIMKVIEYFLTLFPVFTASTSFPILAITLRNNIGTLFRFSSSTDLHQESDTNQCWLTTLGLPLLTIIPPMLVSFFTHDLGLLVGITGSYAGMVIQYIVPSCLVYYGRKLASSSSAIDLCRRQSLTSFRSPFRHSFWVYFVWAWCILSLTFVTINHIYANL